MAREDLESLENSGELDSPKAEKPAPVKSHRSVVSVTFPRDVFAQVAQAAEQNGMRTSEFIRVAAVEKAAGHPPVGGPVSVSGQVSGVVVVEGGIVPVLPGITRVSSGEIEVTLRPKAEGGTTL